MTDYEFDFTDITSIRFLPPGTYPAVVQSVEEKDGQTAPFFEWRFVAENGASSKLVTSTSPKAAWRMQEVLTGLGVDATGRMKLNLPALKRLIGRPATIEVVAREGNDGKSYSEILHVLPAGDQETQAATQYPVDFDALPF